MSVKSSSRKQIYQMHDPIAALVADRQARPMRSFPIRKARQRQHNAPLSTRLLRRGAGNGLIALDRDATLLSSSESIGAPAGFLINEESSCGAGSASLCTARGHGWGSSPSHQSRAPRTICCLSAIGDEGGVWRIVWRFPPSHWPGGQTRARPGRAHANGRRYPAPSAPIANGSAPREWLRHGYAMEAGANPASSIQVGAEARVMRQASG